METTTNAAVQKLIHKTLDPLMKQEGFKRKGRTYYKKVGDIIFVLQTSAVGAYFSAVTNWPPHAFSVWDGVWVDGITPGYIKRYPQKCDRKGVFIPEACTCAHITGDDLKYGICRREEHPYWETAPDWGVKSEAERLRRDIWVMPEDRDARPAFLQELAAQVQTGFLSCYMKCTEAEYLKKVLLERRLHYNRSRGYEEGMPFRPDSYAGNFQGYLEYAVLFYQRYGPEKDYLYYLNRLEDWAKLHKKKIPSNYYCGCGKPFNL